MKTARIVIQDDEFWQDVLTMSGHASRGETRVEVVTTNKAAERNARSDLFPRPAQVRELRKAFEVRERELVAHGFLKEEEETADGRG